MNDDNGGDDYNNGSLNYGKLKTYLPFPKLNQLYHQFGTCYILFNFSCINIFKLSEGMCGALHFTVTQDVIRRVNTQ